VGSSVAGFIAHLLSFREVEFVDLRPLKTNVTGLNFVEGDLIKLPYEDKSLESLSTLHVVEHVGLGRYGDTVDPDGWLKACKELQRILRPGGVLYFSVPIGTQRLEFDAHRVFDPMTIVNAFDELQLLDFSYVDDRGDYVPVGDPVRFQGRLCCGLFLLARPGNG
jgi:SAM-dependent methyltransferase